MTITRVFSQGHVEIWEVAEDGVSEWYVYGVMASGPRVCPSLEMARAVACK